MGSSPEETVVKVAAVSRPAKGSQQGLLDLPPSNEFKGKSVRGGAANVLGQGVNLALQITTTFVLARLLSPSDYGLQAMVVTWTGFFSLFKDAGLSVATVQRETLTHEQISTLFWINLVIGALLTLVVAATGPFLVLFYKDPRLLWLTVASATMFLFNSLGVQHRALMDRAMRFTTSVKIDMLCGVCGAAIAIGMAAMGFGYWSLICQNISFPIIGAAAVWVVMPWRPGKPRWTAELRPMVHFGGTVTLNSFVVFLGYNAEKVLLGRFWGASALGLYSRAYQLANLPVQQLTQSVGGVAFPMLSRMQGDPERLRRSFLKIHSLVVSMTIPVVISCALFADEIVGALLGPKWNGTAIILRLLAPTVLVFAVVNPLSWVLRATNRVARSLKIALVIAPVVVLGDLAGLRHGPPGVAVGYSTAMVLLAVPLVVWAKHGTGITGRDYWESIRPSLAAGGSAGVAGWLFKLAFHNALTPLPTLVFGLAVSLAVYVGLLLFVMGQKSVYADLLSHIFQRNQPTVAAE
jgi:O-antigen/teichoic acid export membrane protein